MELGWNWVNLGEPGQIVSDYHPPFSILGAHLLFNVKKIFLDACGPSVSYSQGAMLTQIITFIGSNE